MKTPIRRRVAGTFATAAAVLGWVLAARRRLTLPDTSTVTPTAPCYGETNTVTRQNTYAGFYNVEFVLHGDTYGSTGYVSTSQKYVGSNPY